MLLPNLWLVPPGSISEHQLDWGSSFLYSIYREL